MEKSNQVLKINLYQVLMIIIAMIVFLLGNAGLNHLYYSNSKGMVLQTRIDYVEKSIKSIDTNIKEILKEIKK